MKKLSINGKGILGILLIVAIVGAFLAPLAMVSPAAAAGTSVSISPASQSVANGASFTVNLAIDTDTASRGWQANMNFDASKLIANSVTEGTFLSNYSPTIPAGVATIDNIAGTIAIPGYAIIGGSGGPSGTGTLCTISFTAKTAVNASASITLSGVVVANATGTTIPGVVVTGGTVAIGNVPMPDLVVSAASAAKVTDTTYTITYTITNQGNDAAGACSTSIVIDGGAPIIVDCPALAAGASDTQTTATQLFSSPTDSILVTADSADAVAESNELNTKEIVYAIASDSGDVIVNGNILAKLDLTLPQDILDWMLEQGSNSTSGDANMKCNTPWQLSVIDQDADTSGHMTKWQNNVYDTFVKLANALNVSCESTVELSGSNQVIAAGIVADQSGDAGQDLTTTFSQQVLYSDPVLTGGYTYHIVVTFIASSTI